MWSGPRNISTALMRSFGARPRTLVVDEPGVELYYQKHMAHHLLPGVGREWLGALRHAYLLRDPVHVIASYAKVRGEPTLDDLGYGQQVEIFRAHGGPVVDAADVLRDPAGVLRQLCAALGLGYDPAMLTWPAGRRDTDGVWAPHWYAAVERSTGFAPYDPTPADVPDRLRPLVEAARPYYDELAAHRLRPTL
ncbi:MAG: sulfotransferase family protein [Actinobacteria bacterium 13_2_20CM_2_71_6]|nr:MAG: sulfotransferase family protein [Actinobacteria bacterium 13_2_20CM_2_71_6]